MPSVGAIGGTDTPYETSSVTPASNDKNTLSMTSYFQLLAVQLQNQDYSNPMSSSEIMNELTQMGMLQAMTSMTEAMENTTAVNTANYAMSMAGQEVTVAVTEENRYGASVPIGVKYGKVATINLTGSNPTITLEGDDTEYHISLVLGLGKLPNPYGTGDSETDTDTDIGTDTGNSNSGTGTDTDVDTDTEVGTDNSTGSDVNTGTDAGTDTGTEAVI